MNESMFRRPAEVIHLNIQWSRTGRGYLVTVTWRGEASDIAGWQHEFYGPLTGTELLDVVSSELETRLAGA